MMTDSKRPHFCPCCKNTDITHNLQEPRGNYPKGFHVRCLNCYHQWFVKDGD